MGKTPIALHDALIKRMIQDQDFVILPTGEIMTRRDQGGNVTSSWRNALQRHKCSRGRGLYWRVSYAGQNLAAHRIIFQRFIGQLMSGMQINHIDGSGLNNAVENLEMVTASGNMIHAYRVLGRKPVIGNAKITQEIAEKIRADRAKGDTYRVIGKRYGICKSNISYIVNAKTWKAA